MLKINDITIFQRSMHVWCRLKYGFGSVHTEFTFSSVQTEHCSLWSLPSLIITNQCSGNFLSMTSLSFLTQSSNVSFQTFLTFIANLIAVLINCLMNAVWFSLSFVKYHKIPGPLAVVFCFFLNRPEPDILLSFSIHRVTVSMYVHMLHGTPL